MPVVSAGNKTLLRSEEHKSDVRMSALVPPILWKARINDGAIVKGETSIDFDAGTGSFFSFIEALQEIWVGSTDGNNDIGRLRIKSISSGDAGVTGTVVVAGHPLPLQDGQYLTFFHDYPLKPRRSYIVPVTEVWYMDDDVVYADQYDNPTPIVLAGGHRGAYLGVVSGTVLFNVDASASYCMNEGHSITTYGLSVVSTAGTPTVNFNTGTGIGDITFSDPGVYWAKYTITDDNQQTQISYRCYLIHDPDPTVSGYPFIDCQQVTVERDRENGGHVASILARDKFSLPEIPDHTLIFLWEEAYYGGTESVINFLPDNNQAFFVGYLRSVAETANLDEGFDEVDFTASTIDGRLRNIFSFSTSVIASLTDDDWFTFPVVEHPTASVFVWQFWKYHSTLLEIADVIGLRDDTLYDMFAGFDEGNLYDMPNAYLREETIRASVQCDAGGRVYISEDQQLMIDSDRSGLTTVMEIEKDDYGGRLVIARRIEKEAPYVTAGGIFWNGTDFDDEDRPEATAEYCSIAPGGKHWPDGADPADYPTNNVLSQAHLNEITGRYEAKINNPIEELRIENFHGNYLGILETAYTEEFTISLLSTETPRGEVWTNKPIYLRHVQASWEGGFWEVNASFEPEHTGPDGETTECPSFPELGNEIPDIPVEDEVAGALVTGSSVYKKSATGSAWTQKSTDNVEDLIEDPFWRAKTLSDSPSDAILLDCGLGFIKRSIDGGDSWSDVTPTTDPPNDAGDAAAPTVGNVIFNQLDGSYTTQNEFVCMVTWQNASSEWRTWLYYSDDNFATNGTWKAIIGGSGNDLTSWNTPSTAVDGGPAGNGDWYDSYPGWSQRDSIRSLAKMSNTKYVAMYLVDRNFDPGYETFWGYCRVIDILPNGTLSVGSEQGPWSYDVGLGNEVQDARIYFWDEDYFIIVSCELDRENLPAGSYNLLARSGSVNGQVITFGTNYPVYAVQSGAISFAKLPGTNHGIILTSSMGSFGNDAGYAWVVQKSAIAYSLSFGSRYTWQDTTGGGGIGVDNFDVVTYDKDTATIFFNSGYDDSPYGQWNLYAIHTTVNRTIKSLAFGAYQRIDLAREVRDLHAAVLTSTRIILVLVPQSPLYMYSAIIAKSGSTYSAFDTEDIAATGASGSPYWNMQIEKISATRWVVFWDDWSPDPANPVEIHARIGYMDSGLHFYGDVIKFTEVSPDPTKDRLLAYPTGFPTTEYLICFFGDDQDGGTGTFRNVRAITADLPIGYEARGLGISISKGAGSRVWLTMWDNVDGLSLIDVLIPTMIVNNKFNLGEATLAEINNRTRYAIPYADFSGENSIMVGGNMDDPYGLGDPTHILYSGNAGSSAALVESGWGADHCGALRVAFDGSVYAIRNRYNQAKLYKDETDFNMLLKLTLSIPTQVAPHGLFLNLYTGDVYVGANVGNSVMVLKVPSPYSSDQDITYDHGVANGIVSIVQL